MILTNFRPPFKLTICRTPEFSLILQLNLFKPIYEC